MPRILLVDDNPINCDMLSRRLIRQGFEVEFAFDGEQAIEAVHRKRPDLILMDMSLPGLSGWDATSQIKAEPTTNSLPIIALTAYSQDADRERATAAGCDDYDTKPIDLPRLLQKIKAQLHPSS